MTLGQRIATANMLAVKYPSSINLNGGNCMGNEHRIHSEQSRRVELLFVVRDRPLCEDCYAAEYKQAERMVKTINAGIRDLSVAS